MTPEIAIVLAILGVSLVLFISEVLRMDLVALLVLGTLAVTGLVDSDEAFAGFSNSAVITVWAMFILSEGLTRTGIADIIGRQVMRIGGKREFTMIFVIMVTGAVLSAFMNNIGVAALMLPVVVEVARRTRMPASRLLMPLAYSTLLGGLMTLIGTPPNLLISESLSQAGYEPFELFDFTPLGAAVMVIGVLFVALFGRFLLPKRSTERGRNVSQRSLRNQYKLHERTFMMRVPRGSVLVGKTIAETRIGYATDLIILSLTRGGRSETLPGRQTVLQGGDGLLIQGRVDQFRELRRWSDLVIEREAPVLKSMVSAKVTYAEVTIAEGSSLDTELVRDAAFRSRFDVAVVGLMRKSGYRLTNLAFVPLKVGDRVLVQGETDAVGQLEKFKDFANVEHFTEEQLADQYHADERMFVVRIPKESELDGETLKKSRLADVFDFRVLAVFRDGQLFVMPRGDDVLDGGDLLLIEGQPGDLDVLRGFQELEIDTKVPANMGTFDSERLTLMDATLDPRSRLAGKTVGELNFRERYGVELAGIWREGETVGTDLTNERLQIGDALLLLGPRDRLQLLMSDSDFLVLTPLGQEPPDTRRAPLAATIMMGGRRQRHARHGAHLGRRRSGRLDHGSDRLSEHGAGISSHRLARDLSYCRHVAARYCDGRYRRRDLSRRPGHADAGRCRALAGHYGALHSDGDGDDDYSNGGPGRIDVAHRAVSHVRYGTRAGNGHDGCRNGSLRQLHQSDFTPGQYSGHGSRRLSLCRLPEGRCATDHRSVYRCYDSAPYFVAAAAGLITQELPSNASSNSHHRCRSRRRSGRRRTKNEKVRRQHRAYRRRTPPSLSAAAAIEEISGRRYAGGATLF